MTFVGDVGTPHWLAAEVARSYLVEPADLGPLLDQFLGETPYGDAAAFGGVLVNRGVLTRYQVTRLTEGQGRGLVMGPYTVVDAIGTGSLGTVYKALGKADHKAYAVKVLPGRSPVNVRAARRKCQAFPTEPHPAVVPFLDVGSSQGMHYLVWPLVAGESLEARVRRQGPLSAAAVAHVGAQVAAAFQYCQRHGMFHGLVKPSNVLLAAGGTVRLLDFGIGQLLADGEDESLVDTMSTANATSTSLDCAAPEVTLDPAARSLAGDQYSLGCTLYFALTGRVPFPDGNTIDKMLAHQSQPPTPLQHLVPDVPAALASVVHRLLQKAPVARFRDADELAAAFAAATAAPPRPLVAGVGAPAEDLGRTPLPDRPPTQPRLARPLPAGEFQSPSQTPLPPAIAAIPQAKASAVIPVAPPAATTPAAVSLGRPTAGPLNPPTIWERFVAALAFWKPQADPVACTVLVPNGVLAGETISVQVIAHHQRLASQAQAMTDARGSAALPPTVRYGDPVGLHLSLPGVPLFNDTKAVVWKGKSEAVSFSVTVPRDWPNGKALLGVLTVGLDRQPVAALPFHVPVVSSVVMAVRR